MGDNAKGARKRGNSKPKSIPDSKALKISQPLASCWPENILLFISAASFMFEVNISAPLKRFLFVKDRFPSAPKLEEFP